MKIFAEDISKKFNNHWVFRSFTYEFSSPGIYAILGPNGSGKSTLSRCLAGLHNTHTGKVTWQDRQNQLVSPDKIYRYMSFCAPAMELIEEMKIEEFLNFHFTFKTLAHTDSVDSIIDILDLRPFTDLPIKDYSSGMKQRVKLAQAFFCDTPLLLLDEPTSNLDTNWISFYTTYIKRTSPDRLVLIASNSEAEYDMAQHLIHIDDYKK